MVPLEPFSSVRFACLEFANGVDAWVKVALDVDPTVAARYVGGACVRVCNGRGTADWRRSADLQPPLLPGPLVHSWHVVGLRVAQVEGEEGRVSAGD